MGHDVIGLTEKIELPHSRAEWATRYSLRVIYPRRRKIYQEWLGNYVGLESCAKSNQFSVDHLL